MPDPNTRYGNRQVPTHGSGPYTWDLPSIAAGDSWRLNLREYEEHGTKGYYTVISESGYNEVEVVNATSQPLRIELNDTNTYRAVSDSVRSIGHDGTYVVKIANEGTGSADDVSLTILQSGMSADTAAKKEAGDPPLRRVIRNFTGL